MTLFLQVLRVFDFPISEQSATFELLLLETRNKMI